MRSFHHDALLYRGHDEFLRGTLEFLQDGLEDQEPILVVVSADKIARLRAALGSKAKDVRFADMAEVGSNPARIIPAWRAFVDEHARAGGHFRGIGEPIWPARTPAELAECQRHEALLNLAFADGPAWSLLCPYDTEGLDPSVIKGAFRNHPHVVESGRESPSHAYPGLHHIDGPFDEPLPDPPTRVGEVEFRRGSLAVVRQMVWEAALAAGLDRVAIDDLVVAVNEVATNSLRFGGGAGRLALWQEPDSLICQISDAGQIHDPLVGRLAPSPDDFHGRGLWLANQLCDLLQIRSFSSGTVIRLHKRRSGEA